MGESYCQQGSIAPSETWVAAMVSLSLMRFLGRIRRSNLAGMLGPTEVLSTVGPSLLNASSQLLEQCRMILRARGHGHERGCISTNSVIEPANKGCFFVPGSLGCRRSRDKIPTDLALPQYNLVLIPLQVVLFRICPLATAFVLTGSSMGLL